MDPVAPDQPSSWLSPEARPGTSSVLPCSSSSRGFRASTRPGAIQFSWLVMTLFLNSLCLGHPSSKRGTAWVDASCYGAATMLRSRVTVFGILNLTEDSFFDESRRLDPAGAVTAAIEMLRVGSDVVDVGPAASHPDARPVSPADEVGRIAPLLDALSDQMHRVSIDSFQPESQRYALKRGVGYLNDIQGFPDPALYPDIAEADCRLVVMHSAQRDGIATRTGHLRPEDALDEIVRFFEARVSALRRSGVAADRLILDPGMGFFLSPAPETSLHVLSNL